MNQEKNKLNYPSFTYSVFLIHLDFQKYHSDKKGYRHSQYPFTSLLFTISLFIFVLISDISHSKHLRLLYDCVYQITYGTTQLSSV